MQDYAKSNRLSINTILFFAALLFIAFMPVASFLFFIKNDAFNGYFPPRFFMSESIHSGFLPLWNPYINYGYPAYGDMSGSYWSPVTWLISATTGYNAYSFTIEILLYILLGGLGMYKLAALFTRNNAIAFIAGISFMCCGYNVGHLQHVNWLSGACFLPWCTWAYLRMLQSPSLKNILLCVLFFYLLAASAHPGILIGAAYFFTGILLFRLFSSPGSGAKKTAVIFLRSHILLLVLLLIVSAGMIVSYLDILPFFTRGEKVDLQTIQNNSTSFASWLSFLFPFSTVKNPGFFNTDISLRNCYVGLTMLIFLLIAIVNSKTAWQKFLLFTGSAFLLMSAEGFVKTYTHDYFPLIGFVRLNGEFRIFALMCFIIAGVITFDTLHASRAFNMKKNVLAVTMLQCITVLLTALSLVKMFIDRESIFFKTGLLQSDRAISSLLKQIIDHLSFYDTLFIQGIIQLILLLLLKKAFYKNSLKLIKQIVIADMIIATLLNVPFTGAGQASVAQLQSLLDRSPKGIVIPMLHPVINNDTLALGEQFLLGNWSMYNKQIGTISEVPYPIVLKNMRAYLDTLKKDPGAGYVDKPFLFITNTDADSNNIKITAYSGHSLAATINTGISSSLIIQQNWYPYWEDAEHHTLQKTGVNFMSVPLQKGRNQVSIDFRPGKIITAMLISLIAFTTLMLTLMILFFKPIYLSLRRRSLRP